MPAQPIMWVFLPRTLYPDFEIVIEWLRQRSTPECNLMIANIWHRGNYYEVEVF